MSIQSFAKAMVERQAAFLTSELNMCQRFAVWRRNRRLVKKGEQTIYDKTALAEYRKYYHSLGLKAGDSDFKIFSGLIPKGAMVVPELLMQNLISPVLSPVKLRGYYEDKNNFDRILPDNHTPETILRGIDGIIYDKGYIPAENRFPQIVTTAAERFSALICKPTVESSSGQGVSKYVRDDSGTFVNITDKESLKIEKLLDEQGDNFILQECIQQSDYMSQFNDTSVNTIRITTYRSVKDNDIKILWHLLRIGNKGSFVDNAHAGGAFVGIDRYGCLNKDLRNQYNQRITTFNDIDYSSSDFQIPNWDRVIEFAKEVTRHVFHHRFLMLDIMLDTDNMPKLIEYNLGGPSIWLAMMTGQAPLGEYHDEIIEYCAHNRDKAKKVIYSIS